MMLPASQFPGLVKTGMSRKVAVLPAPALHLALPRTETSNVDFVSDITDNRQPLFQLVAVHVDPRRGSSPGSN
jgi:hypothetical protein